MLKTLIGDLFADRLDDTITNISIQLVIDTGISGRWTKTIGLGKSAPAEYIVINDPTAVDTTGDSEILNKITSSLFIEQAYAAECQFIGYCSCARSENGSWVSCSDCDSGTMEGTITVTEILKVSKLHRKSLKATILALVVDQQEMLYILVELVNSVVNQEHRIDGVRLMTATVERTMMEILIPVVLFVNLILRQ
jgi:hypothetical protein